VWPHYRLQKFRNVSQMRNPGPSWPFYRITWFVVIFSIRYFFKAITCSFTLFTNNSTIKEYGNDWYLTLNGIWQISQIFTLNTYFWKTKQVRSFVTWTISVFMSGYIVSAAANSVTTALAFAPPMMIPLLMFGGFFLNSE
jgi:hypothetical protein